jgi:hypothetical protein
MANPTPTLPDALIKANHDMKKQDAAAREATWDDYERIRDLPNVDEVIRNFLIDSTGDNSTCMVREIVEAWSASQDAAVQGAVAVPEGWQPIETAPKDGTQILIDTGKDVAAGCWAGEGGARGCDVADEEYPWLVFDPATGGLNALLEDKPIRWRDLVPAATSLEGAAIPAVSQAARDVLAERRRQIEQEGWTPEYDDEFHPGGRLAHAAACYALGKHTIGPHVLWPWNWSWWKPKDRRNDLVRAGALILAEIERLDRAALSTTATDVKG